MPSVKLTISITAMTHRIARRWDKLLHATMREL